jgi:hypothetical protein
MGKTTGVRLALIALAGVLSLASAQKQKRGSMKTLNEATLYDTRPTFTWKAQKGVAYQLKLYRVPKPPGLRSVAYDAHQVIGGTWTVPIDLDLGIRYELFLTLDRNVKVLNSWGFTVGMEKPALASPAEGASLTTLSPEVHIAPLAYPDIVYTYELATDAQFAGVIGSTQTGPIAPYAVWKPPLLQAGTTYHWRLRAHHFKRGTLKPDAALPALTGEMGVTETTGTFAVAAQSGADALAGLTWIMNEPAGAEGPALSKKLDLAYVVTGADGATTIRIAPNAPKAKVPTYGDAREDLTAATSGSRDLHPVWDVDGKGLFFDSDRSQGVRNVWLKKRDSSGYTQVTFHDKDASYPSLSKDGKRVAYQVTGGKLWIADRDGRNASELGNGETPRFSPDGKRIAYALADETGQRHLWIMDANGMNGTQLTTGGDDTVPVWRPDGKGLVFVSDRAGNDDLWQVSALGGDPMQLTTYLGHDTDPAVSPDGKRVLFSSQRGGTALGVWIGELPALPTAVPPPPPVAPTPDE